MTNAATDRWERIYKRTWSDPKYRAFTITEQMLWIYLIAGPDTVSPEGLFKVDVRDACRSIQGLTETGFEAAMATYETKGMVRFDPTRDLVLLPKALGYQQCRNSNDAKGVIGRLRPFHNHAFVGLLADIADEHDPFLSTELRCYITDLDALEPIPVWIGTNPDVGCQPNDNPPSPSPSPSQKSCATPSNDPDTPTFAEFWKAWPRKSAKKESETTWNRLSKADRTAAHDRIPEYVADVARSPRDYMLPTTWLRNERWNDMFEPAPAPLSPFGSDRRPDPNEDDILAIAETFAQPETNAEAMGVTAATDPETAKRVARMKAKAGSA